MGNKAALSRDAIVEAAYQRTRTDGLSSLSVRKIAQDCGVAVGTLYNYFPDKASLVTAVIQHFWTSAVLAGGESACFSYREGENLVAFCRRAAGTLHCALSEFRADWLGDASSLDARTRQKGRDAEQACFGHIRRSLSRVIRADSNIDPAFLARVDADRLAAFVWTGMLDSLKAGDPTCEVLLFTLERALYRR